MPQCGKHLHWEFSKIFCVLQKKGHCLPTVHSHRVTHVSDGPADSSVAKGNHWYSPVMRQGSREFYPAGGVVSKEKEIKVMKFMTQIS